MSVASMVLNRSTMKLVFALAIPASIAWFFVYSQQQATIEVDKLKKEQQAHPMEEKTVIENYGIKEIDDLNRIRWQLTARSGTLMPNGKDVELEDVKVEYYDPTTRELKMRLVAPFGQADQSTKYVKLQAKNGKNVMAEGGQGAKTKFSSRIVELIKKNQFLATGGVIIDWPGVAKVSGDSASGLTDLSSGPKNFKVVGNTHAEIVMK